MVKKTGFLVLLISFFARTAFPDSIPAVDSLGQGMSLYNDKQYASALPWFAKAVQEYPEKAEPYYYLGYCQYMSGDLKDATVNFYRAEQRNPNPDLKNFADKIREKLPPADRKWVDDQAAFGEAPAAPAAPVEKANPREARTRFGVRLNANLLFFNLGDFNLMREGMQYWGDVYEAQYQGFMQDHSVPGMAVAPEINPYIAFGRYWDLGLGFTYLPVGRIYYRYDDPYLDYFNHWDYDITATEISARLRWYAWKSPNDEWGYFLESGLGFLPVSIAFEHAYRNTSYSVDTTNTYGVDAHSLAMGPCLKTGFTFKAQDRIFISFSVGYRYLRANNFKGTYWDQEADELDGTAGTLHLFSNPYDEGRTIILFIPDAPSRYSDFFENQTVLNNSRPLVMDFSGLSCAFDLNFLF